MRYLIVIFYLTLLFSLNGYDLPEDYQNMSAMEKQSQQWDLISKSAYDKLPVKGVSFGDVLKLFQVNYLKTSISHTSDEMPQSRRRIIHTYGSCAMVTFVPAEETPYTGLFNSTVPGIIRASVVTYDVNNLMPGIALKFYIDGHASLNVVALHSIDGQGKDYNFFANPFSNIIPPSKSAFMRSVLNFFTKAAKLFTADGSAMKVSLSPLGKVDVSGAVVDSPASPERVYFYPSEFVMQDSSDNRDFRIKLGELSEGVKLFDVFAETESGLLLIGKVNLESKFTASVYGDNRIFFQHHVK